MLIVAFDGVLFDTLPLRASAIVQALAAEGIAVGEKVAGALVASRSITETIRECLRNLHTDAIDETMVDLAALRANREIGDLTSRGAVLNIMVRDKLRRAAAVTRIVVRADSRRRDVESLLTMAELDSFVSMVRCSDDGSPPAEHIAGASTLQRSYTAILRRMASNTNLLGESSSVGIALEASEPGRIAARTLGFEAPEHFSALTLPGAP